MKRIFYSLFFLILFLPYQIFGYEIKLSWDANTESDLARYNGAIATSYAKASQMIGDIAEFVIDKNQTWHCHEAAGAIPDVLFAALTAVNTSELESEVSNIPYLLYGNIWGTYEDGVSYTNAIVDGQDLVTLGIYFGLSGINHPEYNCSLGFTIEDSSLNQRCDIDNSGQIKGRDLIEICLRYGNRADQNEP